MKKPQSHTHRRMGRPPLKIDIDTKPTMVRLTADVRDRIEAAAGKNRMAIFMREAIEEKLLREEKAKTSAAP